MNSANIAPRWFGKSWVGWAEARSPTNLCLTQGVWCYSLPILLGLEGAAQPTDGLPS